MLKTEIGSEKKVYYSQCWEDADILIKALEPDLDDDILSITSGGDNTLALLLHEPKSITSIDINPAQSYLIELKIAAIKKLPYEECINFFGIGESKNRNKQFQTIAQFISKEANQWWSKHTELVDQGILHIGKFEKYIKLFRQRILPMIHSKKDIEALLSLTTLEEQQKFYRQRWNTMRWRLLFRLFFNKTLLGILGRQPNSFTHVDSKNIANHYLERTEYALTKIPIRTNYFLHFMLTGSYLSILPPYLERENFEVLKQNVYKVKIVTSDFEEFLSNCKDNTFSKFNLSDIFETTSVEQANDLFGKLMKVGRPHGTITYWNNLVERSPSLTMEKQLWDNKKKARLLHSNDRAFVYSSFRILTINK